MSRSTFDWGIQVPWDEKHVMYVWIEALLNYVTAAGYGTDEEKFERLWPADIHIVGKDIARFHAVIWPAMLMAAGQPVPHQVFAHGWLLVGGQKMSKSKANGIRPDELVDVFGSDAYRYYFARALTFGSDGSISWEDINARYHAELANGFGNLASRVAAMIGSYFGGALPTAGRAHRRREQDRAHGGVRGGRRRRRHRRRRSAGCPRRDLAHRRGPQRLPDRAGAVEARQGCADEGPDAAAEAVGWPRSSSPQPRGLRALAVLLNPVMPKATATLWSSLGAEPALGPLADQRIADVATWGAAAGRLDHHQGAEPLPAHRDPVSRVP